MLKSRFKILRRKLRRPFEWAGIYLAFLIIPCFTLKGCQRLASLMAHLAMLFSGRDKKVARVNLRIIHGNRINPYREKVIIYHSFRNMSAVLLKLFWISRNSRKRIEMLDKSSPEIFTEINRLQPSINISAHIGNWEMLSQACIIHGTPMTSVAKKVGSSAMTKRLMKTRSCIGQTIVPANGAIKHLVYALRHNSSLGLLVDQHIPVSEGGAWLKLFGISVDVSTAPATLSRKFNVPILVVWSRPLKNGCYRIEKLKVLQPDPSVDDVTRSQEIMELFEKVIRRHPSCWALNYRRWRSIRSGDDPSQYPFYARPEIVA